MRIRIRIRRPTLILTAACLCAGALPGCGPAGPRAAVDAYREGRYDDAHGAFTEASERAGEGAPAKLLYNRALAALRSAQHAAAEEAARAAESRGGPEVTELAGFLQGNVAFARAELAQLQAGSVEAEPFAFDIAIAYARTARGRWQIAASGRPDWPEARRNVERALLALADLEVQKAEAEARNKPRKAAEPEPEPDPGAEDDPGEVDPDAKPEMLVAELSPEQIVRLLDALALKEREKADVRRKRRRERTSTVERDW